MGRFLAPYKPAGLPAKNAGRTNTRKAAATAPPRPRGVKFSTRLPAIHRRSFDNRCIIIRAEDSLREIRREANGSLPDRYTQSEVSRMLGVEPKKLRYWQRLRLVRAESKWGERFYSFRDLVTLRSIKSVTDYRIPARRLRRAVDILRSGLGLTEIPLGELALFASGREIGAVPPGSDGSAIEPLTGQLILPFHARAPQKVQLLQSGAAEEIFEYGVRCEALPNGKTDAMRAYRQVIEMQPSWPEPHINLGCLHFQLGELEEARNAFCAALALDEENVTGHFNLGCVLDELGKAKPAMEHLQRAIELEPDHADAHFNLASLCEKTGQKQLALKHWIAYLRCQSSGPWSDYARMQVRRSQSPQTPSAPIPFRPPAKK